MSRHAFQNVFFVCVREAIILIAAKRSQVKQVTPESSRLLACKQQVEGLKGCFEDHFGGRVGCKSCCD